MKNRFNVIPATLAGCAFVVACSAAETRIETPAASPRVDQSPPSQPAPTPTVAVVPANDTARHPPLPYIVRGSCEGEDCSYGYEAVACKFVDLMASDTTNKTVVGKVKNGDTVTVQTGNFHVVSPGIVVMKRDYAITDKMDEGTSYGPRQDTLRFFAGDTVYVLDRGELGWWTWWYRGKRQSENEFWSGPAQTAFGDEELPAVSFSRPRGQMWYQVRTKSGVEGWWEWEHGEFAHVGADVGCVEGDAG